ncbi:MAG: glycosyltransferase family 2 protein, partial [Rickettsiales bacterium]|nr:glycosyltransferase family 2 protein [Rickettsiales bacterium]
MANPTCAVIIPIGPGHEACAEKAIASVRAAWEHPHAPFDRLEILTVNDRKGTLGRSAARNQGVREAQKQQCDWLFFLDADDTMLPCAFAVMSAYVADYDAVWGK